jgi:hypothetical protein
MQNNNNRRFLPSTFVILTLFCALQISCRNTPIKFTFRGPFLANKLALNVDKLHESRLPPWHGDNGAPIKPLCFLELNRQPQTSTVIALYVALCCRSLD